MNSLHKKSLSNIYHWLNSLSTYQACDQIVPILALVKICKLNKDFLQEEFNTLTTKFLKQVDVIDYVEQDIFHSLLAIDLVESSGNLSHKYNAVAYKSILKELWIEGLYANKINLLDSVFIHHEKTSDVLDISIQLDRYSANIDKKISKVMNLVEAQSNYGRRIIKTDKLSILLIEAMATRAQRANDITTAARCLRSRLYVSTHDSLLMKSGMKFLLSQQCFDGSFGDYDADLLKIKNEKHREKSTLKIKLIVAIQIVWTIMEYNGYNLFSSFQDQGTFSTTTKPM